MAGMTAASTGTQMMTIPESLLMTDSDGTRVYSNAFVHKSYVLESQPSASVAPVGGASAAELAVATSRANVETPATSCVALLSATQRTDAIEAFEIFDLNGNGSMDTQELTMALKSVGLKPSAAEVTMMIQQADSDGDGTLNLEEFLAMVADQASSGTGRGMQYLLRPGVERLRP
jgi:hypothetical protein